jgi:tripartite-type tricarboxylate transporter receptor subunit TctC
MGDQVPLAIVSISELLLRAQREGRVQILATSGARRSRFLPEVPTLLESGFEGMAASDWSVVMGPPGMAPERSDRIAAAIAAAAAQPSYAEALGRFFVEPLSLPREALVKRLKAEHEAMGRVVQQERITVES